MAGYNLGEARGKIILETDFTSLSEAEKQLGGFKKNASQTGDATKDAFQKTSTAATAGGAAVVAGFAVAVKAASDFEFQLDAVQAVSGATAEEMGLIREAALRIGKDTAYSASEAALAMEELVKAGISTEDVLNGAADAAVALAAAGGVDLPTAAAIAANAMNQFNLGAEDLVKVTDLVAGAANASAIDVNEFAYSLSQVGAVANLAGLSFEDTATAIAAMGNAGIKGSDAGTSLKTMLMNLQPSTEKQAEAMKELGIITEDGANQFYTAEGRLKSLGEISDVLRGALEGMTDAQKQATLEVLFGADAIRGAAVIANEGAEGLAALNEQMLAVSAADVAATRMDNFKGSVEGLMGSLETLWIQIGERLLPILSDMADQLSSVIDWFSEIDPAAQAAIAGTVGVVGAMALVLGIGTKVVLALVEYRASLLLATGATTLFGNAGAIAVAKTKLLAGAVAILNSTLLANPIVRVVAIVLTLVTAFGALMAASEDMRKAFEPVARALARSFERLKPTIERISGLVADLTEKFVSALAPVLEIVAQLLTALLVPAMGILVGVFALVIKAIEPLLTILSAVLTPILEGVANVLNMVVDALDWFMTAVETVFKGVTGQLEDNGSEWSNWYYQTVKPVIDKMIEIMKPLAEAIIRGWEQAQAAVRPVVDWFNREVGPKIQAAWERIQEKARELGDRVGRAWEQLQKNIQPVAEWIRDAVVNKIQTDIDNLINAWNAFRDGVSKAWEVARTRIEPVFNWLKGSVLPFLQDKAGEVADAYGRFSDRVGAAWEVLRDRVRPVAEWLRGETVRTVIEGVENIILGYNTMRDNVGSAWESLQARVAPVVAWLNDNVVTPLLNGARVLKDDFVKLGTTIGDGWQAIQDRIGPVVSWITTVAFPQVRDQVQPVIDKLVELRDKFVEAWTAIQERVQPIIDKFSLEILPRLIGIYETLRTKVDEVATKIGDAWQSIQDRLQPIADAIGRLIGTLQDLFGRFFSSGGDGKSASPEQASQPVVSTWDRISRAIDVAVTLIVAILDGLIAAIDLAILTFETMALAVSSVMNTVKNIVSTVTQFVSALFRGDWANMPNIVKNAWQSLPEGVRGPLEGAYNLVRGIQSRIEGIFNGARNWLFSAGRNIIDGLVSGITSAIDRVRSTLQSVTNLIPDWKGPAERDRVLLEPNGRLIMQSLINGLKSETGNLHGMLGGLTDSIPMSVTQDINANVASATGKSPIVLNLEYYAAPGDGTKTKEDVIAMLGHATEVVRQELV